MIEHYLKEAPTNSADLLRWWFHASQTVVVKPDIHAIDLPEDEVLVRYMDLPKLFDILANSRLILPMLGKLIGQDPFECSTAKSYHHFSRVKLEAYVMSRSKYAPNRFNPHQLPLPDSSFEQYVKSLTQAELSKIAWHLERERLKNDLVCSCWYRGRKESDAMWKIYAKPIGVAVFSSVSRMKAAITSYSIPKIASKDFKLTLARVQYGDASETRKLKPWLIKREAFLHEHEARLTCDCPTVNSPGLELKVDPAVLIEKIVITPFAEDWESEAIIAMIKSSSFPKLPLVPSDHMRQPKTAWPSFTRRPHLGPAFRRKPTNGSANQSARKSR